MSATGDDRPVRLPAVLALLALPMIGMVVLLVVPPLDVEWQHHPAHFWLVLLVAVVDLVLGLVIGGAAEQHADSRTFLVSLVLLTSAGFLGLHALATPGVVLADQNLGFTIATPVGLLLASVLALGSTAELGRFGRSRAWLRGLRVGIGVVIVAWAVASLTRTAGLDAPPTEIAPPVIRLLAPLAIALYLVAAVRYLSLHRTRGDRLPLAVAVAFVLLAEAMAAIMFGRAWRLTWWEWHVLITVAFGVVFLAARSTYRRERSVTGTLRGLYLDQTLERLDQRTSTGLSAFVRTIEEGGSPAAVAEDLTNQGLGADEVRALERSARELVRVDQLLRDYVGPQLASRLVDDPALAGLGGQEVEITVLFADLAGFTAFSETRDPAEIVAMLNGYWERAVPAVTGAPEGMIERFAGDAVLAVFNALGDQPDHALRASRAALGMRDAVRDIADANPGWPRFRIGVNTGRAVIGNVGTDRQRSFTVIGDAVNVAARVQTAATPGEVVLSGATFDRLAGQVVAEPLGAVAVKGRAAPVAMYRALRPA